MQPNSPQWDVPTRRIIAVIAFGFLLVLLFTFRVVLPLVFTSVVLAYLFTPLTNIFQERVLRGRSRTLAVVMTFMVVITTVILVLLFVVPAIVVQIQELIATVPGYLTDLQAFTIEFLERTFDFTGSPLERFFPEPVTVAELLGVQPDEGEVLEFFNVIGSQVRNVDIGAIVSGLTTSFTTVTGSTFRFIGGAFSIGLNIIFLLTMTFYLLLDGKNMITAIERVLPEGYQYDFRRMLNELGYVWNSYLRGQFILSLIMGGAMYILARLVGLPNAIFLAIFAGLMEFLPNIGPTLAVVPAAGLALVSTSSTIGGLSGFGFALLVLLLWTIMQQTEAAFLIPRIVGDSLHLHPFVVLVAVLAGISVGGIFAVFIAAPVAASIRLLGQYVYGKLTGRAPFPVTRKSAQEARLERRPVLVRLGDWGAQWVRSLISSRTITRRN